jgi:hypothetical protein
VWKDLWTGVTIITLHQVELKVAEAHFQYLKLNQEKLAICLTYVNKSQENSQNTTILLTNPIFSAKLAFNNHLPYFISIYKQTSFQNHFISKLVRIPLSSNILSAKPFHT